jgi:hypothetical protein
VKEFVKKLTPLDLINVFDKRDMEPVSRRLTWTRYGIANLGQLQKVLKVLPEVPNAVGCARIAEAKTRAKATGLVPVITF